MTRARLTGLVLACVLAGSALPLPAWSQTHTREDALRGLARDVIAAGYEDLAAKCRALTNAVSELTRTPSQSSLDHAREAWTATAIAANRLRCYQAGPIVDREYAAAFYYSRISPPLIENQLQSSNAMNQAYVESLGGNVKGLFSLEYLLFGQKGFPGMKASDASLILKGFPGDGAQRRGVYALALACDLEAKARQLAQDWSTPGAEGVATKFAAGGQASLNLLVNKLAQGIEDIEQTRFNFILSLPSPVSGQVYRIESAPSGSSLQATVAYLEGVQAMFHGVGDGAGLVGTLQPVNPALAKKIESQFDATLAAIKAIGEPLDRAVTDKRDALQKAGEQVRALEILFKVDLASALGVTITFTSGDGD